LVIAIILAIIVKETLNRRNYQLNAAVTDEHDQDGNVSKNSDPELDDNDFRRA